MHQWNKNMINRTHRLAKKCAKVPRLGSTRKLQLYKIIRPADGTLLGVWLDKVHINSMNIEAVMFNWTKQLKYYRMIVAVLSLIWCLMFPRHYPLEIPLPSKLYNDPTSCFQTTVLQIYIRVKTKTVHPPGVLVSLTPNIPCNPVWTHLTTVIALCNRLY